MENKNEMIQKIQDALMADEAFAKALIAVEDAAAAQKVISEYGFDLSVEEVEAIYQAGSGEIEKVLDSDEELSAEELGNVSGGGFWAGIAMTGVAAVGAFGFGMVCGVCPAAAVYTPYVVAGLTTMATAGWMSKSKKNKNKKRK